MGVTDQNANNWVVDFVNTSVFFVFVNIQENSIISQILSGDAMAGRKSANTKVYEDYCKGAVR